MRFPPLTASRTESLYKQLLCHALYAKVPALGGRTWDFEAWRANIPRREVVLLEGKCNWPPARPPAPQGAGGGADGGGGGSVGGGSTGGGGGGGGGGSLVPEPAAGRAKYAFETWKAAPGFRSPSCSYDDPKCTVGELHAGGDYFFCQTRSARGETDHGYHNHWWLYTDLDSPAGARGWVSAIYVKVGGQEQPIPGLPVC